MQNLNRRGLWKVVLLLPGRIVTLSVEIDRANATRQRDVRLQGDFCP